MSDSGIDATDRRARVEQAARIRSDCIQRLLLGVVFLAIGAAVSCPYWYGVDGPVSVLTLAVCSMCWGVYRIYQAIRAFAASLK
jgi:hypothetical protein